MWIIVLILLCLMSSLDVGVGIAKTAISKTSSAAVTGSGGGIVPKIVDSILNSPLRAPLVKAARDTMIKSAKDAGLDWMKYYNQLIKAKDWKASIAQIMEESKDTIIPSYYTNRFHGYEEGNLCLEAAIEQELAGKSVGIRNFPTEGINGENKLRSCYEEQMLLLGGKVIDQQDGVIVDFGCGTGTSTRRLSKVFPSAKKVVGYDLSPHMIAVAQHFQIQAKTGEVDWIENIEYDERIMFERKDVAVTGLPDNSVNFVNICFLFHELPEDASNQIIAEAARILKPGGIVSILEMDPTSPGFRKSRQNAALFSILKSTEPFLDQYFDLVGPNLPKLLSNAGFSSVRVSAATGRHLCMVGVKSGIVDIRPSDDDRYSMDQHLKPLQFVNK